MTVQALPSLQPLLFGFSGFEQAPVILSQLPGRWHWLSAVHTTASEPTHAPDWQVSRPVQALPSSHGAPSFTGSGWHAPVSGTHTFDKQASLLCAQTTGVPTWHSLSLGLHVSVPLQALPSLQSALVTQLHAVMSAAQAPLFSSQLSTEQASPSSQTTGLPAQAPSVQASSVVHAWASSHGAPSSAFSSLHSPVFGSHVPST
jgi:hypothetical protein